MKQSVASHPTQSRSVTIRAIMVNDCYCQPLSLGVVCFAAIANRCICYQQMELDIFSATLIKKSCFSSHEGGNTEGQLQMPSLGKLLKVLLKTQKGSLGYLTLYTRMRKSVSDLSSLNFCLSFTSFNLSFRLPAVASSLLYQCFPSPASPPTNGFPECSIFYFLLLSHL